MKTIQYNLPKNLRIFVNCIMTDYSDSPNGELSLPLYADGYPGLMFQQSENGFYMLPKGKKLSELFLYGQTLEPITLTAKGSYRFVVFQLYPFASKYLLNIDPRKLNDDCYDLLNLKNVNIDAYHQRLNQAPDFSNLLNVMTEILKQLLNNHQHPVDDGIQNAIHHIIQSDGKVRISKVLDQVFLTERTLERKFMNQIGLTPKQFAKIIQFQSSLERLDSSNYTKLTEVGLESGFSDQSHFIRVFKSYTGLSPSEYVKKGV